jgi:endonuclease IV
MFGAHINKYHAAQNASSVAHIEAARKNALDSNNFIYGAAAIFISNPRGYNIAVTDTEVTELRDYIAKTNIKIIAHSSYCANSSWKGNEMAATCIKKELDICKKAGITGLVVHLPKAPVSTVMTQIKKIFDPTNKDVKIYLETPAVTPKETYYETPKKISHLFSEIRKVDPNLDHFGLCIDSAHLWVNGIDLQSYESANSWLTELEYYRDILPMSNVMIHLNDSANPIGVGPDTHAALTFGKIWEKYQSKIKESGIAAIVDFAIRNNIPTILERSPKESLNSDYKVLKSLLPLVP